MYTFSQKCFKIINIMSGIPLALDHFGNPKTLLYTLLKATLNLLKVKYFTIPSFYCNNTHVGRKPTFESN